MGVYIMRDYLSGAPQPVGDGQCRNVWYSKRLILGISILLAVFDSKFKVQVNMVLIVKFALRLICCLMRNNFVFNFLYLVNVTRQSPHICHCLILYISVNFDKMYLVTDCHPCGGPIGFFLFCVVDQIQYFAIFDARLKENASQGIPLFLSIDFICF